MTITASSSIAAPLATYMTSNDAVRRRARTASLPLESASPQQAAVGAAALKPPRTLMTLLKTVGVLGAAGAALGFAAAFLPLPGARLLSAPIITAALGANIGMIIGMIEGSWKGAHAESEYQKALDAQDAADDAAQAAADAAAATAAAAQQAAATAAHQAAAMRQVKGKGKRGKPKSVPVAPAGAAPVTAPAPQVSVRRGHGRRPHSTTEQS